MTEPGIRMGTYLSTEPGYLVIEEDGRRSQLAIADILRAADIPVITYEKIKAVTALANMVADLTKKLIELGLLPAEFIGEGGYSLEGVIQSIESMGGDYGEPDLSVD
ncbi:hypothetical protein LCGC14_2492340 [marine sediment metagenome]|uniref:Uncharacterized protein n=1 Tax=marine sediment metagenome TaxID=412755 RepID=A0A0F9BSC5_9ZZZZ